MANKTGFALPLFLLPWALPTVAGTATATLQVRVNVVDNCSVAATTLAFGDYATHASSPVDSETAFQVTCPPSTGYTVAVSGSSATRALTREGSALTYGLYRDALRSATWGASPAESVSGVGTGQPVAHPVYGRIPAAQTSAPGVHQDLVTIVVTY